MRDLIDAWLYYGRRAAAIVAAFLLLCYPFARSGMSPPPTLGAYLVSVAAWMFLLSLMAVLFSVFPLVGAYVAMQKGRSTTEGAWLGFLLGPFGVAVELLLPTLKKRR